MTKKITLLAAMAAAAMIAFCGCGEKSDPNATPKPTPTPTMSPELQAKIENTIDATITLKDGDKIELELYPDLAPETVDNFVELAEDGFYDGTIFHRVIEGFMIQGGGYDEDLNEQKTGTITGEFASNGFENELSHTRGVISMARVGNDPDSASSQFFIMHEDAPYLDGEYAAFGRVKDDLSMTVVDDIATVMTGSVTSKGFDDVPVSPIVIKTITIGGSSSPGLYMDDNGTPGSSKNDSRGSDDDMDSDNGFGSSSSSSSPSGGSSSFGNSSGSGSSGGSDDILSDEMTEEELEDFLEQFNSDMESGSSSSSSGSSSSSNRSSGSSSGSSSSSNGIYSGGSL